MVRSIYLLFVFLAMFSIASAEGLCPDDTATIFFTGNDRGELKPCGCSGGQLGGFDRRSAVFDQVDDSRRLVIDTGSFVESDGEQDMIKFNIMMEAFSILAYDAINLTKNDVEIASNLGLSDGNGSSFKIITSDGSKESAFARTFTKKITLKNGRIFNINLAGIDSNKDSQKQVKGLFNGKKSRDSINILIVTGDGKATGKAAMTVVDCLITPPGSDEPALQKTTKSGALVISGGRFGKYIGRVDIIWPKKTKRPQLKFSSVPLTEDIKQTPSLVELYKVYQQLVAEVGLIEKHPRFKMEEDLIYLGSDSCKSCHEYEYEKWSQKKHSWAYSTLEKVGSQYDPECVGCHVVGFDYNTGFTTEDQTPHLKDVGCETCHGPGSEHVASEGQEKTTMPQLACTECHTPEHSTDYADNEKEYFEKIEHWQEQKPAEDVKVKEAPKETEE